jgi:biopolymer transport protein ExbD
MSKFKSRKEKGSPAISTASLPDIVFMLLFFFMVTTVMREVDLIVEVNPPAASEIKKLENKALVSYIYIGPPSDEKKFGTSDRIQLNDAFAVVEDIRPYIETKRSEVDEQLIPKLTTSMKVNVETEMGIVTDVKQELRKVNALKINYSTVERTRE